MIANECKAIIKEDVDMPQPTENVTVRMRPEVQHKLDKIAANLDRSRNWLINQAIEHYLEIYDWQTVRIRERLKQAERGGTFVPHDDVMQHIEAKIKARLQS
jgi:predicted transcriptional regulator